MPVVRRPHPHREPRDLSIEIKVSEGERERIFREAQRQGLSLSSFVRTSALTAIRVAGRDDDDEVQNEETCP